MSKGKTAKRYPYDVEISSNIFRSYTQKHVAMEVGSAISLYEKSVCVFDSKKQILLVYRNGEEVRKINLSSKR